MCESEWDNILYRHTDQFDLSSFNSFLVGIKRFQYYNALVLKCGGIETEILQQLNEDYKIMKGEVGYKD